MRFTTPLLTILAACSTSADPASTPLAASPPPAMRWEISMPVGEAFGGGAVVLPDGRLVTGGGGHPASNADLVMEAVTGPSGELLFQPWTTGIAPGNWVQVGSGDADADGDGDLLTVTTDFTALTYRAFDTTTRAQVATFTTPVPVTSIFSRVYLVESDGDALPEVLITSYVDVLVLDDDGAVLARNTWGAGPITAGYDYLGDGVMDAVGPDGTIYRGSDLAPLAALPGLNVKTVADVDVDGDGDHDLLLQDGDAWALYDGATLALRWTLHPPADLHGPVLLDLDGDGARDLIFGADHPGVALTVHDPLTGAQRTTVPQALHGLGGAFIAAWDHDQDGTTELAVSFGSSAGLYDPQLGWGLTREMLFPTGFIRTGDPDGDGFADVLVPFVGGNDGQTWTLLDAATGAAQGSFPHALYSTRDPGLLFGDLDDNGDDELIVGLDGEHEVYGLAGGVVTEPHSYPAAIGAFHAHGPRTVVYQEATATTTVRDGQVLWQVRGRSPGIDVADLNGDGIDELIRLTRAGIEVREGATGALLGSFAGQWKRFAVDGTPGDVRIAATQDVPGCTIDLLAATAAGISPLRATTFDACTWGVQLFNDHLFVPGLQLTLEEVSTGARTLIDAHTAKAADIQPIDGGFVVQLRSGGVRAYDLP